MGLIEAEKKPQIKIKSQKGFYQNTSTVITNMSMCSSKAKKKVLKVAEDKTTFHICETNITTDSASEAMGASKQWDDTFETLRGNGSRGKHGRVRRNEVQKE